jgi:outer membrane receptor for ferrienterochelin and colicin
MNINSFRGRLMATTFAGTALAMTAAMIGPAFAQAADESNVETVVVTGSRIHRAASDTTTATPLATISAQDLIDRGYIQVGDALNTLTSMAPSVPVSPGNGASSGSGQQFPNLFNLGAARTLSLVNGRRFVNSGTGLGDNTVDTNMAPLSTARTASRVLSTTCSKTITRASISTCNPESPGAATTRQTPPG